MNIEQVDENKIKVTVNAKEQQEYGITYETMNYGDANTRRLCEKIMSLAGREIGFRIGNSRLLVEARQSYNGNVTLYLSRIPYEMSELSLHECCMMYDTLGDILDSLFIFREKQDDLQRSDIYELGGHYYLYFEILCSRPELSKLTARLNEYGSQSRIKAAFLNEYGNSISSDRALHRLIKGIK